MVHQATHKDLNHSTMAMVWVTRVQHQLVLKAISLNHLLWVVIRCSSLSTIRVRLIQTSTCLLVLLHILLLVRNKVFRVHQGLNRFINPTQANHLK